MMAMERTSRLRVAGGPDQDKTDLRFHSRSIRYMPGDHFFSRKMVCCRRRRLGFEVKAGCRKALRPAAIKALCKHTCLSAERYILVLLKCLFLAYEVSTPMLLRVLVQG